MNRLVLVLGVCLVFLFPAAALAHKVSIYAYQEGDEVRATAYFVDGSPCKGCEVGVTDPQTGEELLRAVTDSAGELAFRAPSGAGSIRLIVRAGPGHEGRYTLHLGKRQAEEAALHEGDKEALGHRHLEELTDAALANIVSREVEPLRREVVKLRMDMERPGLGDVLAGVGYIMGLAGLAAYLRYRKKGGGPS
ncbi:MAG: hypothetical protein P8Y66_08845 [Nitrospirota bacterium]|jgi:nickel transport protein